MNTEFGWGLPVALFLLILAVSIPITWRLARRRAMAAVAGTVQRLAAGDLGARLPECVDGELAELCQGINRMAGALESLQEHLQERVESATQELARQKETAERANEAKSRFLAAASHDLRQPMHAIGLFAAALPPYVDSEEGRAIVAKIEAGIASLEELLGAILDVSKLDAGAVTPRRGRVSVSRLLDRLRDDFQYEAGAKGLHLRVRDLPLHLDSDPVLLDRILRNLLSNALRYTDRGGVLVSARRHGGGVRLQVWDSGVGIREGDRERVFQEFYQAHNPQRDKAKGLGLGLAIVQRLCRLLDHPLSVRSRPGRGTVFTLDVPLAGPLTAQPEPVSSVAPGVAPLHGKVLVVDDQAEVVDAIATLLSSWGLEVIAARSVGQALEGLDAAPDLVISDYLLNETEDGIDLAATLARRFPEYPMPVVFVTGDTSEASIQRIRASGHTLLHKPVQPAKLRVIVSRLLRKGAA